MTVNEETEYPPQADLRTMMNEQPVPLLAPGLVDPSSMAGEQATIKANALLDRFNIALVNRDADSLADCFYESQAYWKDILALTYHLRTFSTRGVIAAALLKTNKSRQIESGISIDGAANFLPATPVLQFIDCPIVFRTQSPAATCRGKMMLLPVEVESEVGKLEIDWKIWILSTKLESFDIQTEDESLLQAPGKDIGVSESLETEVFIIGGGNAAVTLSARLKALGVESVMAERTREVGDNWALRYDCLKFHIPTTVCEMPFLCYDKELRTPHLLSKDELASQVRRYVETFKLNIITSAKIKSTQYDMSTERWEIEIATPAGKRKISSKQLVLATGFGSQKPNMPYIPGKELYKGTSIHSAQFKSGLDLKEKGIKSVVVIGSANTAFDVLEDCHTASLQSTMNVRSPTYMVPLKYVCDKMSLGAYDAGVEASDNRFLLLPTIVDGQLARNLFRFFASQEPNRYEALKAAGFPALDSSDPSQALMYNLLERAGGHCVDVGGTKLIEDGKVAVKANVEPVAYTPTGLQFSDGSVIESDAIVWCTGFADGDLLQTGAEILGAGASKVKDKKILGPEEIVARLEVTWGVDAEGEIRGMWKRNPRLNNFWVMGGYTQLQRWHSQTLALQIKATLENILPPAYLETPQV
ncbi:unnamed protein product [Penicillium pancosmium]